MWIWIGTTLVTLSLFLTLVFKGPKITDKLSIEIEIDGVSAGSLSR
jgi:hypothetical protein